MNTNFEIEDKKEQWIQRLLEDHTLITQAEKDGILEYLEPFDWVELIIKHPIIGGYCKNWDDFSSNDWSALLSEMPYFFEKCQLWNEFDVQDWIMLLSSRPNMKRYCRKWNEFSVDDWVNLLSQQPNLAYHCEKWSKFTLEDWEVLPPKLYEHCPKEILKQLKPIEERNPLNLQEIILRPTFELTRMLYPELSEDDILHKQDYLAEHFLYSGKINIPYGLEEHKFSFENEDKQKF